MATFVENLMTARDNFAAKLAEISADPKPSYSDPSGESYSWTEYYNFLSAQIKDLNAQIALGDGGWEIDSQGAT
jgi:hypothetical protein